MSFKLFFTILHAILEVIFQQTQLSIKIRDEKRGESVSRQSFITISK